MQFFIITINLYFGVDKAKFYKKQFKNKNICFLYTLELS